MLRGHEDHEVLNFAPHKGVELLSILNVVPVRGIARIGVPGEGNEFPPGNLLPRALGNRLVPVSGQRRQPDGVQMLKGTVGFLLLCQRLFLPLDFQPAPGEDVGFQVSGVGTGFASS